MLSKVSGWPERIFALRYNGVATGVTLVGDNGVDLEFQRLGPISSPPTTLTTK